MSFGRSKLVPSKEGVKETRDKEYQNNQNRQTLGCGIVRSVSNSFQRYRGAKIDAGFLKIFPNARKLYQPDANQDLCKPVRYLLKICIGTITCDGTRNCVRLRCPCLVCRSCIVHRTTRL